MNKVRNTFIVIGVLIVFIAAFFIVSALTKKPEKVKNVTFFTYSGVATDIKTVAHDNGAVIVFFDPEIEGSVTILSRVVKNADDAAVIAVSVSKKSADEQLELLDEDIKSLDYLVFDSEDFIKTYNIGNPPVTYFVDSEFYVRDAFVGKIKEKTVKNCIKKIVG